MESRHNLNVGDRLIEYSLVRKKVKNVNLRIKPDGSIYVSANERVSLKFIEDFLYAKSDFILKALERFESIEDTDAGFSLPRDGDKLVLLGKKFVFKTVYGYINKLFIDGDFVCLSLNKTGDASFRERVFLKCLKDYAFSVFDKILREIFPKFSEYGIAFPILKVQDMRSIWGSCHTGKKCIKLNLKLLVKDVDCIAYVIVHELAHLIVPNHSKAFWDVVLKVMPQALEFRNKLKLKA